MSFSLLTPRLTVPDHTGRVTPSSIVAYLLLVTHLVTLRRESGHTLLSCLSDRGSEFSLNPSRRFEISLSSLNWSVFILSFASKSLESGFLSVQWMTGAIGSNLVQCGLPYSGPQTAKDFYGNLIIHVGERG